VSSAGLPAFFGVSAPNALAAGFCAPRQNPTFSFGFAALNAQLGASMGTPLDCEHSNPANGDTLQETSEGLAFYRKATSAVAGKMTRAATAPNCLSQHPRCRRPNGTGDADDPW